MIQKNHVQVKHHSFEHLSVEGEPWFIEDDKDANGVQSVVVDNPGDDIKCSVPVVILQIDGSPHTKLNKVWEGFKKKKRKKVDWK